MCVEKYQLPIADVLLFFNNSEKEMKKQFNPIRCNVIETAISVMEGGSSKPRQTIKDLSDPQYH